MLAFALLAAALATPELRIAPDQPSPYIFADEPLVLEFSRLGVEPKEPVITCIAPDGSETVYRPGTITTKNGGVRWVRIDLDEPLFGPYAIDVRLTGTSFVARGTFQRIRRPRLESVRRLVARPGRQAVRPPIFYRLVPVGVVTLESVQSDWMEVSRQLRGNGMQLRLRVPPDYVENGLEFEWDADQVDAIMLPVARTAPAWIRYARSIKATGPAVRIVLDSDDPQELIAVLRAGGSEWIDEVAVPTRAALTTHRAAAEVQGYEGLAYSVSNSGATTEDAAHALAAGARRVQFDITAVHDRGAPTAALSRWNAFSFWFGDAVPAGIATTGEQDAAPAIVFRLVNSAAPGAWAAIAADSETLRRDPFDARTTLLDEFGNPITDPARFDQARMAYGSSRAVVGQALAHSIRAESNAIAAMPRLRALLSDAANGAVDELQACTGTDSLRGPFFSLLQSIPVIEQAWHGDRLLKREAVPALASIERIARLVGGLEQALGLPFLEPIEETLSRCAEHQTRYLASAGGSGAFRERGDWLLEHVSDLTAEARRLDAANQSIEADALAALAEWRARALTHTVNAKPLTMVEPAPPDLHDDVETEDVPE